MLSNNDRRRLKRAMKVAGLSEAKQKHGAVIYRGGALISVGVNVTKNDPKIVNVAAINPNCHAETMAIRACSPDADLSNAVIYVARVNALGFPRYSAPCATCQEAISMAGIKRIVYTRTGNPI